MACEDSRSTELKACESGAQEAQPLGPPSPPTHGCPLLEEGSVASSEGESEDAKPKAVKTVDARVSALKALQGISTVVSKSRKVDAEALQQIKQQRARARAEQASAPAGSGGGTQQGEVPLAQCSSQLDELTSSGGLLRHLSLPSTASCGPDGTAKGAAAAAALGTASSSSHLVLLPHPFITPPSPFPTLCTNSFASPLQGLQPAQGAGAAAKLPPSSGSAQLPPLLRPQLSLPANFSPADVSYQSRHSVAAPLVQQPSPADGSGGLPPALVELLPSLSVQELLSLRSAVETLLLQHAAASLSGSTSLNQAGSAFLDTQQAQRAAQQQAQQQAAYQQAEQVLQHAQREAQALQQLQQAQRAQQASAILQSLSAAAAGGPFSPDVPVLPHPHVLLQQRPTPFQSAREDEQQCASSGGGGSLSPITSLDAPGRGSGQTLSPATSGGLGVGEGTTAEQHLLGESLSSFLDVGPFSSSQPRHQDLSWPSIDANQQLPRSISMPAAAPICTARSASLSSYLGSGTGEPGGTDAAAFLFSSLQIETSAPPQTPSMRAASLSQSPPNPVLHRHSPSLMAQHQQPGLNLPPQQPRVGAYRSVRFHDMGRPAQPSLPQLNQ